MTTNGKGMKVNEHTNNTNYKTGFWVLNALQLPTSSIFGLVTFLIRASVMSFVDETRF